jgi:hypothetical protein
MEILLGTCGKSKARIRVEHRTEHRHRSTRPLVQCSLFFSIQPIEKLKLHRRDDDSLRMLFQFCIWTSFPKKKTSYESSGTLFIHAVIATSGFQPFLIRLTSQLFGRHFRDLLFVGTIIHGCIIFPQLISTNTCPWTGAYTRTMNP